MKNLNFLIIVLLLGVAVSAQSPQSFRYQAVARDNSGNVLANQNVSFRISILSDSVSGTAAYSETHTGLSTNAFGLVELEIGKGTPVMGAFSSIDWGSSSFFVKNEMDPAGGSAYQVLSTSQLLSVPYALYSQKAGNGFSATAAGEMLYWNGTAWITVPSGNEGEVLAFVNGIPTWSKPAIPIVGSTDVYNHSTGKIWMDRNMGASQVATSSIDDAAYGDLYQWGRRTDGHQSRTSGNTTTLSSSDTPSHGNFILSPSSNPYDWRSPQNDNLWQGVSGTNNPCPSGYRLPTEAEWDAERQSWSSNNSDGAFASPLRLPVAGYRAQGSGSLGNVGSGGYFWSSTISGTYSRYLSFNSSFANRDTYYRARGYSVRCLKD